MQSFYNSLIKPSLFKLDPEHAHELTVEAGLIAAKSPLKSLIFKPFELNPYQQASFSWKGLHFVNRIGLAAGFDKNALLMPLMQKLGFGFLEIGSVTAKSSNGNPKPRLFRLPKDEAIINRMGLNNDGVDQILPRIELYQSLSPIGINIAKTHSPKILGDLAIQDYVYSFKKAEQIADYITINISCPNTEEGKTFEDPETLTQLLSAISSVRVSLTPILVKLSVDAENSLIQELVGICLNHHVDGFICSNTSSKRANLSTSAEELSLIGKGGLSGKPVFAKSLKVVEAVKSNAPDSLVIGVGGIFSGNDALAYVKSGADMIQLYTGLIYRGPALIREISDAYCKHFA